MSTSQRVSRGFHRLALFLAAIPLLVGGFISVMWVPDWTAPWSETKWRLIKDWADVPGRNVFDLTPLPAQPPQSTIYIDGIGVQTFPGFENLSPYQQQKKVDRILAKNWRTKFAWPLAGSLAITLAVSLATYGVVRAIGWVIGGFAA